VETRGFDPGQPHYVVGLGLNVRQREFPADLRSERAVASLLTLGVDVKVEDAREAVLESLSKRIGRASSDLADLAAEYLHATGLAGRHVRVRLGEEEHGGQLVGLTIEAGLHLRCQDGVERRLPLETVRELVPSL
jgi:biotin-(acetyl-CoA carboxylase) ligase